MTPLCSPIPLAALRRAAALAHTVPTLALALSWADGRRAYVSHDPSFQPVLSPCLFRWAVIDRMNGPSTADWLAGVVDLDLGGPFVEWGRNGVVAHDRPDGHCFSFVADVYPVVAAAHLGSGAPPGVGCSAIDLHQAVDTDLGLVVVHVTGPDPDAAEVAAHWAARRLRTLEHPAAVGSPDISNGRRR